MAEYILQEATLALPDVFKDRTMNLFTMSDNGASEFTFVVSCATAKNEDKVHDAATRLTRELEITVPDFRLESSQMTSVNGHPAVELFYQFKNDNSVIFQKQTVILLADHPGGQKMVLMFFRPEIDFLSEFNATETEVLFKPNTSFEVISRSDELGITNIELRVIP